MKKSKPKWGLIEHFPITHYRCGAKAGDRVKLRKELVIRNHADKPTGKVFLSGDIWTVLRGATESPGVLWLRDSDQLTHTWEDSELFWSWFEMVRKKPVAGKARSAGTRNDRIDSRSQ